jgi:hypothetical protein
LFRSLAMALGVISLVPACSGGSGGGASQQLASDQTLSFPMVDDIGDLDPALMQAVVGYRFSRSDAQTGAKLLHQIEYSTQTSFLIVSTFGSP